MNRKNLIRNKAGLSLAYTGVWVLDIDWISSKSGTVQGI